MVDVNDVLAANRAAVLDLIAAAERSAATWTSPSARGKWSPSQVVEHVARGLEEGANVVSGAPSIPMPPAFLRSCLHRHSALLRASSRRDASVVRGQPLTAKNLLVVCASDRFGSRIPEGRGPQASGVAMTVNSRRSCRCVERRACRAGRTSVGLRAGLSCGGSA